MNLAIRIRPGTFPGDRWVGEGTPHTFIETIDYVDLGGDEH